MKDRIKDYFSYDKKEQRGLIILLGLLILSLAFSIFAPLLVKEKVFDPAPFQEQVEAFLHQAALADQEDKKNIQWTSSNGSVENMRISIYDFLANPFFFDPNVLDEQGWEKTGLDERVIRNITRYRQKGGKFKEREDLGKIYGMPDSVFILLKPFISIEESGDRVTKKAAPDHPSFDPKPGPAYTKPGNRIIGLNSADSSDLTALPGIGPYFASRIIKYRELLGGYVCKEQILEVRGMDTATFTRISEYLVIDTVIIKKINLNTVTFKEMLRHPYFEYHLVKAIFGLKDRLKAFDSVGQVRLVENMYPELYDKIAPYLEVAGGPGN